MFFFATQDLGVELFAAILVQMSFLALNGISRDKRPLRTIKHRRCEPYQPRLADRAAGRSRGLGSHAEERRGLKAYWLRCRKWIGLTALLSSRNIPRPLDWPAARSASLGWYSVALRCLKVRNGRLSLEMPFRARKLI